MIMARPKTYDSNHIIGLVEDFFVNVANGDPCMLKFSYLEKHLNENGLEVKAYNLRRDPELLKKIEELKKSAHVGYEKIADASYKNLDIEEFIRKSYDLNSMRKALAELDEYWKEVYFKSNIAGRENKRLLSERSELIKNNHELEEAVGELTKKVEQIEDDRNRLASENVYLRGQIKKYIYPAAANVLLGKMNLPKNKDAGITNAAVTELIDEGAPKAFDGIQKKKERRLSREEELLEEMKRMVES
jgi:hypothetical protein